MANTNDGSGTGARGAADSAPGVVSVLEVYRLDEAKRRLGWSDSAFRAARRRGLNVLVSGKRRYITGQEILRFLEADDAATQQGQPT